jgi:two-component system, cell cycle response regulator
MTARVLVVDDILANVRLLEAKLTAEYFDVVTAMNGLDALEAVQRTKPDIILLDVMMPGIDGIEVCKRIKADPNTQHIPVVMVTALDQPEDRVRGLEAGADDFLTKPVNDIALFCRIKSLVRLKMLTDELRIRSESGGAMDGVNALNNSPTDHGGRILFVDPRQSQATRVMGYLEAHHRVSHATDIATATAIAAEPGNGFELIIIGFDREQFDGLRLCSQFKTMEATRQTPILAIVEPDENQVLLKALDMGVNDYLLRPVDRQELMARVSTQVKRWRYTERLRQSVKATIEMAITDPLTGLFNRRYMETHLGNMIEHYVNRGKQLSVIAVDVDFFKAINDSHGHAAGDKVLQELAQRLRDNTRSVDFVCRTGGEEFIVVLPSTNGEVAAGIAERLRRAVASKSFGISQRQMLPVTISAGMSVLAGSEDTLEKLLQRADDALYQAKREGRNRVIQAA